MHTFYTPDISGTEYTLSAAESKHCIKVLRLSIGSPLNLVDGKGGFYNAKIIDNNHKRCKVKISKSLHNYGKRDYRLHIAISPTKNISRFEWFLEKATEIGIDSIIPFISHQSERKVIKPERLQRIILSAMKQSQQAYLPKLEALCKFDELIKTDICKNKYIAHCADSEKKLLKNSIVKNTDCLILIGPEGDFTSKEITAAINNNYQAVSLGNTRLRTETAGIVAVHTVVSLNEQ